MSMCTHIGLGLVPNGRRTVTPVPANVLKLVPKPTDNVDVVKGTAPDPVRDTVPLMMKLMRRQKWQGKKLADHLRANSLRQTVKNNWDFIFRHIQYVEDGEDEVIKSLRKLIHSGSGDCDCFTNALGNLLLNQRIPFFLRVAKYNSASDWSHIYIVIPVNGNMKTDANGNMAETNYITLDCVPHQFNYEVPFTDHKDFAMKLVALDGLDCPACEGGSKLPRKDRLTTVVPSKLLLLQGIAKSSEVLEEHNIPYEVTADKSLLVATPTGLMQVDEYIDLTQTDDLVKAATLDLPMKKTMLPDGATVIPIEENIREPLVETTEVVTPDVKKAGGFALALLALSVAFGAMRKKKTAALSGPPAKAAAKKLRTLKL